MQGSVFSSPRWVLPVSLCVHAVACILVAAVTAEASTSILVMPTSILVVGAAVVAAKSGHDTQNSVAMLLGGASYALYLVHTIVLEWMRHKGVAINGMGPELSFYLALSIGLSIVIYKWIEPLLTVRFLSAKLHAFRVSRSRLWVGLCL